VSKFFKLIIFIFVSLGLAGCFNQPYYGKVGIMRPDTYQAESYLAKLRNQGIFSVETRRFVTLIIPAQILFNERSANFYMNGRRVLNNVAQLLKCYDLYNVRVEGLINISDQEDLHFANVLARERANQVTNYLRQQSIDATIMTADGFAFTAKENKPKDWPSEGDFIRITYPKYWR
jgi:outer membrane protein OmpA-like peptidoglycan-associated protein